MFHIDDILSLKGLEPSTQTDDPLLEAAILEIFTPF